MLDTIGFYGPIILLITNIYYLFYKKTYLYVYLLFFVINSCINRALKAIIREPRPNDQRFMLFENKEDVYGMPSGHAQSIFYSTTFLYLTTASYYLLIISLFVCALTIYQRYHFRRHTLKQLFIGSLVGIGIGSFIYQITKYYISTKTKYDDIINVDIDDESYATQI